MLRLQLVKLRGHKYSVFKTLLPYAIPLPKLKFIISLESHTILYYIMALSILKMKNGRYW